MSDCCSPQGYRSIFSERNARAEAKRYRRKGLDPTSRRISELVRRHGIAGNTVLEIGGGIGSLQLELLKAGAARATSVELTPTYEDVASELTDEAGLRDRVERRLMDFAATPDEVAAAGVVIMNRVVCCYPDMPRLVGAAADHAQDLLVLSYPRDTWWTRIGLRLGNLALRLARREFHIYLHSPKRIIATSEQHGLSTVFNREGTFWTVAAFGRPAADAAAG